jgi:hypothetical protein
MSSQIRNLVVAIRSLNLKPAIFFSFSRKVGAFTGGSR